MKLLEHICNSGISARIFEYLWDEWEIISSEVPELRSNLHYLNEWLRITAEHPYRPRKHMFDPEWDPEWGMILHQTRHQPPRVPLPDSMSRCYLGESNVFPWAVAQYTHSRGKGPCGRIQVYDAFVWKFKLALMRDYKLRGNETKVSAYKTVSSSSYWPPLRTFSRMARLPYWSVLVNMSGMISSEVPTRNKEDLTNSSRLGVCVWGDYTEIVSIGYLVGQLLDESGDPIPYF